MNPNDDYRGVAFTPAAGTTLADLTNLSADFQVTQGDCGGGSPRFSLTVLDANNNPKSISRGTGSTCRSPSSGTRVCHWATRHSMPEPRLGL